MKLSIKRDEKGLPIDVLGTASGVTSSDTMVEAENVVAGSGGGEMETVATNANVQICKWPLINHMVSRQAYAFAMQHAGAGSAAIGHILLGISSSSCRMH